METYYGHVRTPTDAIILFEACRLGLLPRVQRRLSEKERQTIKSGSVFVWDEREAGMRRWTDGKSWSASRVAGSFLNYREMEGKRGGSTFTQPMTSTSPHGSMSSSDPRNDPDSNGTEGLADGYRYKPDGLVKQSFSITTTAGQHLHLISYYSRSSAASQALPQPSTDPNLRHIQPPKGLYPESSVADGQSMPAVTRSPMVGSYSSSPSQVHAYAPRPSPAGSHYGVNHGWPPSPMHTPPAQYGQYSPYPNGHPPPAHTPLGHSPAYYNQPPFPPHAQRPPSGPTAFDRAPPALSNHLPPPPPPTSHPYPPSHNNGPTSTPHPAYPPHGHPVTHAGPPHMQEGPHSNSYSHPPNDLPRLGPERMQGAPPTSHGDWARGLAPSRAEVAQQPPSERPGTIPGIGALVNGTHTARTPPHPALAFPTPQPDHALPPGYSDPHGGRPMGYSPHQPPRRPSPPTTKRDHGSYEKSAFGSDNSMLRQLDKRFSVK